MIGVIDYGMGNLRSVRNAFTALGAKTRLVCRPEDFEGVRAFVLPGVGAFADGIANLHRAGLVGPLEELIIQKKRPFLGICLGMQLLADEGTEHGRHAGLGWVKGRVERLRSPLEEEIRIPHTGWNEVQVIAPTDLFTGLRDREAFYFVHSYVFVPEDRSVVTGTCAHGQEFVASLAVENIQAVQFHPEKSHKAGLSVLKNWLAGVTGC